MRGPGCAVPSASSARHNRDFERQDEQSQVCFPSEGVRAADLSQRRGVMLFPLSFLRMFVVSVLSFLVLLNFSILKAFTV